MEKYRRLLPEPMEFGLPENIEAKMSGILQGYFRTQDFNYQYYSTITKGKDHHDYIIIKFENLRR